MQITPSLWAALAALILGSPAAGAVAGGSHATFKAQCMAAWNDYNTAASPYWDAMQKAKSAAEADRVEQELNRTVKAPFFLRFRRLVHRAPATESGEAAVIYMIGCGTQSHHQKETWTALESLAHSRDRAIRALGLFYLARTTMDGDITVETQAQARAHLETAAREYGDTPLGKKAAGWLFRLAHLQTGQVAPDFQAVDQDGKSFKLSDYRGKVVVLDFWGFW